jgi:hypothetical protein
MTLRFPIDYADEATMRESQLTAPKIHSGVGTLILLLTGVIAVTPLVLALAIFSDNSGAGGWLLIATASVWLVAFAIYRGLVLAQQHRRRALLRRELANTRRARLEASDAFQDRLNEHHAVLDRIAAISDDIVTDGITDPQRALRNISLIAAHARDAQIQIEDSIIEVRVETGVQETTIESINARDEIERVVAPFARKAINVATSGPRHFIDTDPAVFRLIVRSLIAGAIDRDATDIDVSIARDGGTVVCTVSDNGPDCSRLGLEATSALAQSLAAAASAELRFLRVLGRNQFSVEAAASETTDTARQDATPMDVLGELPQSVPRVELQSPPPKVRSHEELITFLEDQERDRKRSVAVRRKRELLAR